jgi:hypothetical protein
MRHPADATAAVDATRVRVASAKEDAAERRGQQSCAAFLQLADRIAKAADGGDADAVLALRPSLAAAVDDLANAAREASAARRAVEEVGLAFYEAHVAPLTTAALAALWERSGAGEHARRVRVDARELHGTWLYSVTDEEWITLTLPPFVEADGGTLLRLTRADGTSTYALVCHCARCDDADSMRDDELLCRPTDEALLRAAIARDGAIASSGAFPETADVACKRAAALGRAAAAAANAIVA